MFDEFRLATQSSPTNAVNMHYIKCPLDGGIPPFIKKKSFEPVFLFFSILDHRDSQFVPNDDLKNTFWCSSFVVVSDHTVDLFDSLFTLISVFSDFKSQCFGIQTVASQPFPVFVC